MPVTYLTFQDLYKDTLALASSLPFKPDWIVGIPRSGMLPAFVLAKHFDCGLMTLQQFIVRQVIKPVRGVVLLIDDSFYGGTAMGEAIEKIFGLPVTCELKTAVIYMHSDAKENAADYYSKVVPSRRYFQWNLMHHPDLKNAMSDIDGVLCVDPTAVESQDPDAYAKWLPEAQPLYIPTVKIGALISLRLNKWKEATATWLKKHGVKYDRLILSPGETPDKRELRGMYGEFKGIKYLNSDYNLFIESSARQSEVIAKISQKPVICLENSVVYQ